MSRSLFVFGFKTRMRGKVAAYALVLSGSLFASLSSFGADAPKTAEGDAADNAAILAVIDTYSRAVATRDENLFMSTMLDDQVPVFSANDSSSQKESLTSKNMHILTGLRNFFFHSDGRFTVTFDQVSIRRDRSLADVFAHFVTHVEPNGPSMDGWKSIQMLKVGDRWKIASELYTIEPMKPKATADK